MAKHNKFARNSREWELYSFLKEMQFNDNEFNFGKREVKEGKLNYYFNRLEKSDGFFFTENKSSTVELLRSLSKNKYISVSYYNYMKKRVRNTDIEHISYCVINCDRLKEAV